MLLAGGLTNYLRKKLASQATLSNRG